MGLGLEGFAREEKGGFFKKGATSNWSDLLVVLTCKARKSQGISVSIQSCNRTTPSKLQVTLAEKIIEVPKIQTQDLQSLAELLATAAVNPGHKLESLEKLQHRPLIQTVGTFPIAFLLPTVDFADHRSHPWGTFCFPVVLLMRAKKAAGIGTRQYCYDYNSITMTIVVLLVRLLLLKLGAGRSFWPRCKSSSALQVGEF